MHIGRVCVRSTTALSVHFPPVCFYCCQGEEALIENVDIKELKTSYAHLFPVL